MFTGLIETVGVVLRLESLPAGARLSIAFPAPVELTRGESIAVNGACLTALPTGDREFTADLSPETLDRTTLGGLRAGAKVHLERALALGSRLGGHMVQGHIDGIGTLVSIDRTGEFALHRWSYPAELAPLLVDKGSIAVDGVSLTVVGPDRSSFGAALIPETLLKTTFGAAEPGRKVNLEFDMIAKYVRNLVSPYQKA